MMSSSGVQEPFLTPILSQQGGLPISPNLELSEECLIWSIVWRGVVKESGYIEKRKGSKGDSKSIK